MPTIAQIAAQARTGLRPAVDLRAMLARLRAEQGPLPGLVAPGAGTVECASGSNGCADLQNFGIAQVSRVGPARDRSAWGNVAGFPERVPI